MDVVGIVVAVMVVGKLGATLEEETVVVKCWFLGVCVLAMVVVGRRIYGGFNVVEVVIVEVISVTLEWEVVVYTF